MISIAQLTTSDAVRGLLGVSEAELPDEIITAAAVDEELLLDLSTWLPNDVVLVDIIVAGSAAAEGTEDWATLARLSAYAKAFGAHFFVLSQENWRLTRLGDGQIAEQRKDAVDLEALAKALQGLMGRHRAAFLELVTPEAVPSSARVTLAGASKPSYDPVTG